MQVTKVSPRGDKVTRSNQFWDIVELSTLRNLFYQGDLTIDQMATKLGRSHSATEKKLAKLGLRKNQDIHKYTDQFKRQVAAFYEETNGRETCEKFNIKQRQLEGILRRVRNVKGLPPIKIGERRNEWRVHDVVLALRYLGLKPVSYIADKLDKTESSVESYFKRRGYRLHYVNGLKQEEFYKNFTVSSQLAFMRNLDGDVFIPWGTMEDSLSMIKADQIQILVIKSMAHFQRFLHGCKNNSDVILALWERIEE